MLRRVLAAVATGTLLCACGDPDAVPTGDPERYLDSELRGYEVETGVIVGADRQFFFVQQAMTGHAENDFDEATPRTVREQATRGCVFRRPASSEFFANVRIAEGGMRSPVYAFSRKRLTKDTKRFIESYKQKRVDTPIRGSTRELNLHAVDVVVTETSRPVYLVLQSTHGKVLWNIHTAEGAKVRQVVVIGGATPVAVANLPEGARLHMVDANSARRCGLDPARMPRAHWIFVQRARSGMDGHGELYTENMARYRRYADEFAVAFGDGHERGVIGDFRVSHVLVGPLPATLEDRVAYAPLDGADIKVAPADYILTGDRGEVKDEYSEMVLGLARRMAGGDLASLRSGR